MAHKRGTLGGIAGREGQRLLRQVQRQQSISSRIRLCRSALLSI